MKIFCCSVFTFDLCFPNADAGLAYTETDQRNGQWLLGQLEALIPPKATHALPF